jgi:hypothetical protein
LSPGCAQTSTQHKRRGVGKSAIEDATYHTLPSAAAFPPAPLPTDPRPHPRQPPPDAGRLGAIRPQASVDAPAKNGDEVERGAGDVSVLLLVVLVTGGRGLFGIGSS